MPDPIARLSAALEGRYVIERELGQGGMATVYLAADLKHERKVALKVLKPELAAIVGAERFLAEIKTTANLQHPNILPLFDSGGADSFLFYVMPYVEGETLRDRLDREKQLPIDEAVRIVSEVAEALHAAHEEGVIHRDIKPANILMSRGRPLVSDFGIALAVSAAGDGRMTETGLSLGTPHYMSPEQATGDQQVGRGTDIYALGCVLYEMLVGEPPYTGSTAQAILGRIISGEPVAATRERASVPAHVDAAIRKALEKLPADRFRSASAFAEALANPAFGAETRRSGAGAPDRSSRTRTIAAAAAAGALLGLAGFLAGRAATPESTPRVARFVAPAPAHIVEVVACCGPAQTVSPDGEWLVYVGVSTEGTMLYRRRASELEDEPIAGTEGASSPFFSPDGRFVGYFADGRIRRIPLTGGASVSVAEVGSLHGGSWGDNDVIVFTTVGEPGANLWTVPASGGEPRPVPIESYIRRMYPWMLPGGTAALARVGTTGDSPIVAVDLATGREDTLGVAGRVAFASGHLVTWVDGTLLAQPFDPERRRALGPAVTLLDGVGYGGPGVGAFAMSREGTLVYVADSGGGESTLVIDGPGGSEVAFTFEFRGGRPVFSPDGRRLAMAAGSGDGAAASERGIWLWDRDQRTRQLLVQNGGDPIWTPDGRRIAFSRRDGDGASEIYWVPADGSGPAESLFAPAFGVRAGSWTPDGTRLVFASRAGPGNWDIGIVDPAAGEIRWLAREEAMEADPVVSPDGRWVAYVSDRSGQDEVYVRALDGSGGVTQVSAGGGRDPQWAPSGSALYYARAAPFAARAPLVRAQITFDGVPSVVDRVDGPLVGTGRVSTWAVGTQAGEFAFVTPGTDGGLESQPTFVWVLGWPEIVRGLSGGR